MWIAWHDSKFHPSNILDIKEKKNIKQQTNKKQYQQIITTNKNISPAVDYTEGENIKWMHVETQRVFCCMVKIWCNF